LRLQLLKDFVVLQVDGISIIGQLFLPDDKTQYPVVCLCHGAPSGNPPDPDDGGYPALAERVCREGFAAFFFNFRGAGDSGGNMDLIGWTHDLHAAIDYLWSRDNIDRTCLSLVGFSAGAATSIYIASRDERVSAVVACASPADFEFLTEDEEPQAIIERFRGIGAIRDQDFPPSIEGWFANLKRITPVNHINKIAHRQLLIVHGSQDDVVPVSHAYRLHEKAGEPKKLLIIDGVGHRLRREDSAVNAVLEWLKSCCRIADS
jgi:dipeptidyl aminopeptidase/acylaminoacyl peptidase